MSSATATRPSGSCTSPSTAKRSGSDSSTGRATTCRRRCSPASWTPSNRCSPTNRVRLTAATARPTTSSPRCSGRCTDPRWVGSLTVTSLSLASGSPSTQKVDALVVFVSKGPKGLVLSSGAEAVQATLGKGFVAALTGLGATGKAEEVTRLATLGTGGPAVVVAVGLGEHAPVLDAEVARRAAGAAVRALAGTTKVAIAVSLPELIRPVAEGALLGAYTFTAYRSATAGAQKAAVRDVVLVVPDAKD